MPGIDGGEGDLFAFLSDGFKSLKNWLEWSVTDSGIGQLSWLGDDHLILRGGGGWQIWSGQIIYFHNRSGGNLFLG